MRRISLKNCPHCGCSKIYVSSSATRWDKICVVFLLQLVRCHICMRRHFRPIFVRAAENPTRKVAKVFSFEERKRRPA